jgi:hypothetical protein
VNGGKGRGKWREYLSVEGDCGVGNRPYLSLNLK